MIIEQIKNEILLLNQKYIDESEDGYDFWNNHIKYVVEEAMYLAETHNADKEIVELAALLHDVALMAKVGTKADHHKNGEIIAGELLNKYGYPEYRIEQVQGCIFNHRSSSYATNIEELCVADADILAHFDNISSAFILGATKFNFTKPEEFMEWFQKDYEDLSDVTKISFQERYNNIMSVLFGDLWEE